MNKIVPDIDTKGLREFGFVTAAIVVLLFGLFFPVVIFDKPFPDLPWAFQFSVGLSAVALILPVILKPVYIVWMYIGFVLGWINTRIILSIVFYILFTPVAFALKVLRKDPMRRKISQESDSYKEQSISAPTQQMEKPY